MLNSANIFIPKIEYPLESIVCLFNSNFYSFLYKKKFDSIKILRNHIEELPLPVFSATQHEKLLKFYYEAKNTKDIKNVTQKIDTFLENFFDIRLGENYGTIKNPTA